MADKVDGSKPEEGPAVPSPVAPSAASPAIAADANAAAPSDDPTISFKVKTSADTLHSVTMVETASVIDLKTKLATAEFENIPVERQRLIYSGRVMKNDEPLATYKIKSGNTIHMVKSAASNPTPRPSGAPTAQALPANMAAGTANNPLAALTGARFAGMNLNLPSREMFGADAGLGAPPGPEDVTRLLRDPNYVQTVMTLLDNPDMLNAAIQANPVLRSMPNALQMLQSPMVRSMLTNPEALSQMATLRGMMGTGSGQAFPAPGATDTTPQGAAASGNGTSNDSTDTATAAAGNPFSALFGPGSIFNTLYGSQTPAGMAGQQTGGTSNPAGGTGNNANDPTMADFRGYPPANPEAMRLLSEAMLPPTAGGAANAGGSGGPPPFGLTPDAMRDAINRMMQGRDFGGGSVPEFAVDTRTPEERYATQLGQLNDMGFTDFDRNVAALRRSGGNVQGAVEYLLSG